MGGRIECEIQREKKGENLSKNKIRELNPFGCVRTKCRKGSAVNIASGRLYTPNQW